MSPMIHWKTVLCSLVTRLWPTASHSNSRSASITCRRQDWPCFPWYSLYFPCHLLLWRPYSPHLLQIFPFSARKKSKSLFKDHHYMLLNKTVPFAHCVWGIKEREIGGRREPFQSASVFMTRKFLKDWLLSPSSFPMVLEERSPWPDTESCGTTPDDQKCSKKKRYRHQEETEILLLFILFYPQNFTPRISPLLNQTA